MTLPVRRSGGPQRWDPIREFEDLFERMGRLMQTTLGGTETWAPLADVSETEDAYIVEIDVPGVQRQDLNIEVDGNELTVTGELKEKEQAGMFRRRTRRVGQFAYNVMLPGDLDNENVDASLKDGVLTIRVPKSPEAKARRIEITG